MKLRGSFQFRPLVTTLAIAGLLPIFSVVSAAPEATPPKLTPKDFRVLPFCGTQLKKKLDPKDKTIFDELKVTTSDRIRIHGKKERDTGKIGAASFYHLGKVALAPSGDRTGTLSAKVPSTPSAISYFVVLDLGNELNSKGVPLEKGKKYTWTLKTDGPNTKLAVFEGNKELGSVAAPAANVAGFGFAATARWVGNEVDLAVEFN